MTVLETFVDSSPSHMKSLFYTDMIESIEWQDLVPRQRIGDCFKIHFPRWGLCDLLPSNYQRFLLEVLRHKEPLSFWFARRPRNFGLWEGFEVFGGPHQFPGAIPSLRSNTGPEDELDADCSLFPVAVSTSLLDESCGGDVEDDTLPELVDNLSASRYCIGCLSVTIW